MSRVDVIVPCYKYACFLRECVESVLSQSLTDVRVLIIDDASPDHTPKVAARLAARDKRVEYRRHAVNQGHIATYNEGLDWAEGDYTLLLSADDLLTPGALSRAARLMDAHPEVGFVYGRAIVFNTGESLPQPGTVSDECEWQIWDGIDWLEARFDGGEPSTIGTYIIRSPEVIVRTRLQRELGGYREDLPHFGDSQMWVRFAAHGAAGILDADQAFYRIHEYNMSNTLAGYYESKTISDTLLYHYGHHLAGRERLQNLVMITSARESLVGAYHAFYNGDVQDCHELIDSAIRTYPDTRSWKQYRRLIWMLRVGPTAWNALRRLAFWRGIAYRRDAAAGSLA